MSFLENLQEYYNNMIQVRKSMGYTIGRDYCYIRSFVFHCGSNYEDAIHIKKEMIDSWIVAYDFKKTKTQSNAIALIRTFCRFINATGGIAYIPDEDYSLPKTRYKPYIFNDEEIRKLFDAIDASQPHPYAPNREYIFPVLFRMMFCCGMRPNEPLALKREDINLVTGEIYIRQSKNNKDRHIVMSPDLLALCCEYDQIIGEREWFFQKWDNEPCCGSWVRIQLDRCWKQTELMDLTKRFEQAMKRIRKSYDEKESEVVDTPEEVSDVYFACAQDYIKRKEEGAEEITIRNGVVMPMSKNAFRKVVMSIGATKSSNRRTIQLLDWLIDVVYEGLVKDYLRQARKEKKRQYKME